MNFYQTLVTETAAQRSDLLAAPVIRKALNSTITLGEYVAFLSQAYHHVKHTVPLLMATGARLPVDREWLRQAVATYINEEAGHHEWILNDIDACGFNSEKVRTGNPEPAAELLVAYAYDTVQRVNPLGLFGMVFVLEGTSVSIAVKAAGRIRHSLKVPDRAFSYLDSHGTLDVAHMNFFEALMNRIDDPTEQRLIVHCARMFYRLYGDIFRSLSADTLANAI